jgi:alkylhydroperoxidase family enzyme
MATFEYSELGFPIRDDIVQGQRLVWERLAAAGTWWTGAERIAIARQARAARSRRADPAWLRPALERDALLSPSVVETVWRIAIDAQRLDEKWCRDVLAELGDAPYVELVSIVVCVTAIDALAEALGVEVEPLPAPLDGEPSRARPEAVADEGAWVPMSTPWQGPNVGRALSLVPEGNAMFMGLVMPMYAGAGFAELVWKDRPLSRPQVELVAARVSAVNECFY